MYSIGLDIGIASVGWSVIDSKTGRIIDLGVRLFSARNSDNNSERRGARGGRRLLQRKITRLKDSEKALNSIGIFEDASLKHVCPYSLRVKGLTEELSKGEIYRVVQHIIKKRGISYLDEDASESAAEGQTYKDAVARNESLLKDKTPGEIQLARLKAGGRVRTGYNALNEYQLNVFTVRAYANELNSILEQQQQFHPEITNEFIELFISKGTADKAGLVYRKRPYYHGPGNEANNSPYGRWVNYKQDGYPKHNIFDQLIGSDLRGDLRASNLSLSAQKFNLLNDLNNLTLNREIDKITTQEKNEILKYLMVERPTRFTPNDLAKRLGLTIQDIRGWRVEKNDKPQIHSMASFRKWSKIFEEYEIEINDIPDSTLDELAKIVTLNTEKDAIIDTLEFELAHLNSTIKEAVIDRFKDLRAGSSSKSWHSFSPKLLQLLIPELLNTSEEQNTILERLKIKKELRNSYSDYSKIPINAIIEEIYNPTVAKSVRQALRIFNSLLEVYPKEQIEYVTVEMPRDKNEKDQKDIITKIQKQNEARKSQSTQYFMTKSGWNPERFDSEMSRRRGFAAKLHYYYEQDGICAYSGKPIAPDELLTNATEIDHIIPLSISLDDSINNKVLVKAHVNQEKGQRSPYQAFHENAPLGQSWDDYVAWVNSRPYKKHKKKMLLEERDIFDPEIRNQFVARNLNDTRYSSRVILNTLDSFFYETTTKVKVVNGSYTHTLRKRWGDALEKNRETHHHHAVDATLCAVSPFVKVDRFKYHEDEDGKRSMVDTETGELIPYNKYKKMSYYEKRNFTPKWDNFIDQLLPTKLYPKIKFSHQVDRKSNRKVSDATLYSTRERVLQGKKKETIETYTIDKIKDIYTADGWKKFYEKKDALLMKELDEKTYQILLDIAAQYPSEIEVEQANGTIKKVAQSPFKLYCEDNGIPFIQKYSKKGNGPIIKSVKYHDKKVGLHLNITKDTDGNPIEETSNRKKVILRTINPWRTDVYFDPTKNSFILVGIKYSDCKYKDSNYGIPLEQYEIIKKSESVTDDCTFCFSLYRNDGIQIKFEDKVLEGLYHSRTTSNRNYFEMKPNDRQKYNAKETLLIFGKVSPSGQFIKGIKPGMKISKFHTDYLGNKYFITSEELKGILN